MSLTDFAASLQHEGEPAVGEKAFEGITPKADSDGPKPEEKETDTPSAPPADKETKTDKPPQEGEPTKDNTLVEPKTPFHQHPRWIERENKFKELERTKQEYEAKIQTYEKILSNFGDKAPSKKQLPPMPEWFTAVYGKNEEMWAQQVEFFDGLKAQARQEFLDEQMRKAQEAQAENDKWQTWVKNSLDTLRGEGLEFDENELQKVALDYLPSDTDGNIDFRKAYEIMNKLKKVQEVPQKQQIEAKKQVADMTMGKSKSEKPKEQFQTPESLRNTSWDKLIRE